MRSAWLVVLMACSGAPSGSDAHPAGEQPAAANAGAAPSHPAGSRTDVSMQTFIERHGEGLQIVDVRTDGEWAEGHVPGAVHVPLQDLSPQHPGLAGLDLSKPVYFVCAVGGRSARAADQMSKAGIQAVNVEGGTNAWIAAGQEVVKP